MDASSSEGLTENKILKSLSPDEYRRLLSKMTLVELAKGRILCEAGEPAQFVYFPLTGVISLVSTSEDGDMIEVAMVGNEGVTGIPIFNKTSRVPYRAIVRVPGRARRIQTVVLREEVERSGPLRHLMNSYTGVVFYEVTQSCLCNRKHSTEERLCRWLLCTRDRVDVDRIELTHEALANMLGTQRPVVSAVAGGLQKDGVISYSRGALRILDRKGLEDCACECYDTVRELIEADDSVDQ
jgi:CRP-like cAMP-binding protein